MKRNTKQRQRNLIILVIVLIIVAISGLKLYFAELRFLHDIFSPIGTLTYHLEKQKDNALTYLTMRNSLVTENKALKERLEEIQVLLQDYEELSRENLRLKQLLKAKPLPGHIRKLGYVIGRSPDFWHKEIIINLGNEDGVKLNDPVIGTWGLVGQIKSVSYGTATVQLITDNSSWVSCLDNRSRAIGILKGEDAKMAKLHYLVNNSDFKENDLLVTSGLGGVFPKGLPVGIITRVTLKSKSDIPEVEVSFLTDFERLEEVIVLTNDKQDQ